MTEQQKTYNTEETIKAAVEQVGKTAENAVTLGRKVTALWLGVTRSAVDAAAATLKATSDMITGVSDSVSELSDRLQR
jgi:methyl-accepting chemotaxis protein